MSLFLVAAWIFFEGLNRSGNFFAELIVALTVLSSLVLHECSHYIAARWLGVEIREIILFPFGSFTRYLKNPGAGSEMTILLAGPAINASIFLTIWLFHPIVLSSWSQLSLISKFMTVNFLLAFSNIFPIISLDGGKFFRALAAYKGYLHDARLIPRISSILSLLFFLSSFYSGHAPLIIFFGIVFATTLNENLYLKNSAAVSNYYAEDVMVSPPHLEVFHHGMTCQEALDFSFKNFQPFFPVLHGNEVMGLIDRDMLLHACAVDPTEYLSGFMSRQFFKAEPKTSLKEVWDTFYFEGVTCLVVMQDLDLAGLITKERLYEFIFMSNVLTDQE